LLVFVPISLAAELASRQPVLIFLTSSVAILPLAGIIGEATEQLARHSGPRVGGLLNATAGNITELIVAVLLVYAGEIDVLKASLIGSILGNQLLVLGLAFLVGGLRVKEQRFNARSASVQSTAMLLALTGLLIPALFVLTNGSTGATERSVISLVVAGVLIACYAGNLAFLHLTHHHLLGEVPDGASPDWSARRALFVLLAAAIVVGVESELLVSSLEPTTHALDLSKLFVGLIIVPVVANAAEHGSAVLFAIRDRVELSVEICVGSSTQIALFVAPLLVFVSFVAGHPMDFVFNGFEVAAVALATIIVGISLTDGRSNWLEGMQLLGAYLILGISFFYLGK
jgi:Ca2+:H+ antiporter